MGEPTSVSLVRTNPSVFNPKNPRGSLSTVIYIFVRITGALMEVKEMEKYMQRLLSDPIISLAIISKANEIGLNRLEAMGIALERDNKSYNYYRRKLHLEDPFLERLYSMKGLVV